MRTKENRRQGRSSAEEQRPQSSLRTSLSDRQRLQGAVGNSNLPQILRQSSSDQQGQTDPAESRSAPPALSDRELDREIDLVRARLLEPRSYAGRPVDEKYLTELERESSRRDELRPDRKQSLPQPVVDSDDGNELVRAMTEFESIRPSSTASGLYTGIILGTTIELGQAEVAGARREARSAVRWALTRVRSLAEGAKTGYSHQQSIDSDQWFVSGIVRAVAEVRSLGAFEDPGPRLRIHADRSLELAERAERALEAGRFVNAAQLLAQAEIDATKADRMWKAVLQGNHRRW